MLSWALTFLVIALIAGLLGFAGMYFLLGVLFILVVLREIGNGPESDGVAAVSAEAAL